MRGQGPNGEAMARYLQVIAQRDEGCTSTSASEHGTGLVMRHRKSRVAQKVSQEQFNHIVHYTLILV
jgi:hypothetical protein